MGWWLTQEGLEIRRRRRQRIRIKVSKTLDLLTLSVNTSDTFVITWKRQKLPFGCNFALKQCLRICFVYAYIKRKEKKRELFIVIKRRSLKSRSNSTFSPSLSIIINVSNWKATMYIICHSYIFDVEYFQKYVQNEPIQLYNI